MNSPTTTNEPLDVREKRTRRRTQAERRAEAQSKLIDAAIALIAERGFHGASLAEIGDRAGFSRSIAAHHFGDKEGVLRAIIIRVRADFRSMVDRSGANLEGLARILKTVDEYLSTNQERMVRGRAFYFMFMQALMAGGALREEMTMFTEETRLIIETHIRRGIELGEIRRDVIPDAQAMVIVALMRGMIGQYVLIEGRMDLDSVRAQLVESVRRMLAVH
ncbi:TetR/AcrR family transcriptional regulator [Variovorax sp. DT-64]|uniref:TetR/AcrR family transcriptional regulator n=1 Tax=Variovorax sp. DT-64 TaxID=3396160 RepID=UPI003F1A1826